jgi:DNA-binding beta-propeller fold protein YncE
MSEKVDGTHLTTLRLSDKMGNIGLALSADGMAMAVSNYLTRMITLYALPRGDVLKAFGGKGSAPGQFNDPRKLCFTGDGTLLVAEDENKRLQEVTSAGMHVRFIGVGIFRGPVAGVACNGDIVVANQASATDRIVVFDLRTGSFVLSFGNSGSEPGDLNGNAGLRLSPDGRHIVVAEADNNRLSVFTVGGDFLRCFGEPGVLNNPVDVCITDCGAFAVPNNYQHNVVVFSSDGRQADSTFGRKGDDNGQFQYPCAVSLCCGKLFVLDFWSDRVQVFE